MSGASSNTSSSLSVGGVADTVEQVGDLNLSNLEVQLPSRHDVSAEEEAGESARSGRREGRAGSVASGRAGGRDSGGGSRVVSDESEVDVLGVRRWLAGEKTAYVLVGVLSSNVLGVRCDVVRCEEVIFSSGFKLFDVSGWQRLAAAARGCF